MTMAANNKKAVSVSLGSASRDKRVEIELLGKSVVMERLGTDGDPQRATTLFTALDGRVDALGVGGIDLWVELAGKRYPLYAAQKMVRGVANTPVVDGTGLKNTLERHVVRNLVSQLGSEYAKGRVLLTAAVDRYGMTQSFYEAGYEVVCADFMFSLGIPIPIRSLKRLKQVGRLALPVVGRFPISFIYPTGDKQESIVPRYERWYQWANVIAGDCHYIKRHMPDDLEGKVIVTNTTTGDDMEAFRARGVRHVMTTTPRIEGRSFGTNMLEAALTAIAEKNRPLETQELQALLDQLDIQPSVHTL
ncbi:MAG TPA: quinate 5-dehydrogenase [Candidatus Binatia bacterium]|nr:quinate 5-dehydrogenase [Candidatus Binatia bacterium]